MYKKRTLALLLGCLLLAPAVVHACSCLPIETFCNEIRRAKSYDELGLLVVRGIITEEVYVNEYRTDRMFEIIESFINPRALQSFRVQEGNGADCGRFLGRDYQVGDEFIVIVQIWNDTTPITHFSECSPAPLRVKGDQVTGKITQQDEQTMSLADFRSLQGCLSSQLSMEIFPNPSSDRLIIRKISSQDQPSFLEVEVFDLLGRRIYQYALAPEEQQEPNFEIETHRWQEGNYLLSLRHGTDRMTQHISIRH